MRIAHINLARTYRGGERQAELLIHGLAALDVEQILVARRGSELARRFEPPRGVVKRTVTGGLFAAARATRGADLVHAHEGRAVYAAWLAQLTGRRPFVITRRVNNPLGRNLLTRRAYRQAATVVGVSHDIAALLASYDANIPCTVIHSVGSGLEADAAELERLCEKFKGRFIVGHVGALDNAQKGQEFIVAVARKLAASHPDIHFVLVGGGPDEAMLRRMADDLDNVSFTGFSEHVGDYLALFDIFILPSNREGIGGILIDAMQFGLPLICAAVGGTPEIVHEDVNGFLIEPRRPDQLEDRILRLYRDPALRQRLAQQGREIARDFTPDHMARQYLDVYRRVVGRADA